ncbi:outer membrane protein assembly factor BamC [Thiobacillus sedimenti]|uniref:Outer membrane protein assembly factor BamC n=1 Tax=Thiobacillus sedimenti TaxID=3110231 RepID=A0ABZ1CEY3_9PROT|nr:outer membrane protein assembly factor BamC [Thiobacillus sp. SCUT-2]WRS37933.1 outer membrane protein assembly factor BamC [Thiobacillus sp. SCUT-2]
MRLLPLFLMVSVAVSGCGIMETKKIDYKSAQKAPTLEVPPDLVAPTADNRYAIPDAQGGGTATLSAYSAERKTEPAGAQTLLPTEDKVRIVRAGSQRWLVVNATPQQVWPVIKDFWQENGFIINLESPETGIMETDWAENRAKIPQDIIRRTIGKVIDGLYSTPERDKFRTRIETGKDGTEIYISHRGMKEVYATEGKDKTVWEPRDPDPELEAEMLRRLMLRFGVEKSRADALLAQKQAPEQAHLVQQAGAPVLQMDEAFDRAWRRVGLALDRVGFAVEDRDRSKGIYYVRYIDPDADNASKRDDGILAKFAFWRSKKPKASPQLQVVVSETGEKSEVSVTAAEGKPADEKTRNRILNLLYKELK